MNQIHHDIVTGRDSILDGTLPAADKVLGVAQPHIRTMGETGDTHQVREHVRIGVVNHLSRKRRTEFRDAESSRSCPKFLRRKSQRIRTIEQGHGGHIIKRNGLRVAAGQVLQHLDYRRVIVPQNIKLNQTAAYGMVIEMGSNRSAVHIVGRVLNGRKEMHVHIAGHNHDAGRMLAGCGFHTHTAMGQPVDIGDMFLYPLFLEVFFHITKSGLICHGLNGTGAVYVVLAKEDFRVLMCHRLVSTREVQIDIGNLIAIEAQEHGKRDIVAVLDERRAADRTFHIRQVIATAIGAVCDELAVLTMRTAPMRRQRINFGNARHGSDKGRTYGTTGAYQIAIVI